MKAAVPIVHLRTLVGRSDLKATVILIGSAILLSVHRSFGSMEFWAKSFGPIPESYPMLYMFVTAFILLGVIPLLLVRYVFQESPADFGVRIGDWKTGTLSLAILAPIIAVTLLYPASQDQEIRGFYPYVRVAATSPAACAVMEGGRVLLFYTSWEFFFRGFMLFGLRRQFGAWPAVCIQVIPQCLWHIGMPTGELLSSIAGGVLFAVLALRTGSILWPYLLHCFIGLCTDLFMALTR